MSSNDTLADRLETKLQSGEISQEEYDELYEKFTSLGILSTNPKTENYNPNVSGRGTNKLKGGKVHGNVNLNGNVEVENSLECNRLSVSGTVNVKGDLTVLETTIVTGEIIVDGSAKFVDKISVSGRIFVDDNVYSLNTISLSGKTTFLGDLITEGKSLISGKFNGVNIKSTGSVRINSKASIEEDILADSIEIEDGNINVGGSIKSKEILIFTKLRSKTKEKFESDQVDSVGELISNVVNFVFPTLIDTAKGIFDINPSKLTVNQNLEGDFIDVSNTTIIGDIIGDDVFIGPNVKVNGSIKYRKSIDVPANSEYIIEKID